MQSLRNFFHIDKWWGKTIFVVLTYVVFWCVFYGSAFLMPDTWFSEASNYSPLYFLLFKIYVFLVVPLISFVIPKLIRKLFKINSIFLYSLHIFLLILCVVAFLFKLFLEAFSNWQIGSF